MKDKEGPDLGKPFIIYAYPGSFFFALGMQCVYVCICTVFFMILFRQLGGYLIAALVGAFVPLALVPAAGLKGNAARDL